MSSTRWFLRCEVSSPDPRQSVSQSAFRFEMPGFVTFLSSSSAAHRQSYRTASHLHQASVTLSGWARYSASRTDAEGLIVRPDRPGSVSLTPAGRERSGVMEGGQLSFARFEFSDAFLSETCDICRRPDDLRPLYNVRAEKFHADARYLAALLESSDAAPTFVLEQFAVAAMRRLARDAGAAFGNRDDAWMHPRALRRVIDLAETNLAPDLSLAKLAREAGSSVSALIRGFRGSLGMSPGAYIVGRRTARAAHLLAETDMPIAEIAASCGFSTQAHLANMFRARYGRSPTTFRTHSRA